MIAVQNDSVIYVAERKADAENGFISDFRYEDALTDINNQVRQNEIDGATWTQEKERIIIKSLLDEFYRGGITKYDGRR